MANIKVNDTNPLTGEADCLDALEREGGGETRSLIVQEREGVTPQEKPVKKKSIVIGNFDLWTIK